MTIFNLISMLGGLALFLYGMRVMGDGLKQGSSSALKTAMSMVTNNPFLGFLLGLFVTGVIQSSSATVVLTAGLVSAGIVTVRQCIGVVIGAHLGTTVTGQIIRLLELDGGGASWIKLFQPSTLAPLAAILGIALLMSSGKNKAKLIGTIAMGFCILFTGLMNMSAAVSPLSQSETFSRLFMSFEGRPLLGFLTGLGTALLFHSSASVGILQALSVTGSLTFGAIYAIMLGIYMGDCLITGLMISIGASKDSQRVGCVHILYCIAKDMVILAAILILKQTGVLDGIWSAPIRTGGIANANTLFNLGAAVCILPFTGIIYKLTMKIIKGEGEEQVSRAEQVAAALNKNLFASPELALAAASNVIGYISKTAAENVERSFQAIGKYDEKLLGEIDRNEDDLDMLTDRVGDYLANLSAHVRIGNETNRLNYYVKCVSEFERIGDLADNVAESSTEMHDKKITLTSGAKYELSVLHEAITDVLEHTHNAFMRLSANEARYVEPIEEVVDDLIIRMKDNHYERVGKGECTIFAGYIFIDILTNLERISDQCANIAVHTISLNEPAIADAEHEYIRALHMGEDEDFNQKYKFYVEKYLDNIQELGKSTTEA
ncbi:MAG: Na/Pi cotransporter family protein [Lachnospiraceae bacterium]|nr:Na/Pi cotransporter family protein [Lachnospiraceae bacterium]